MSDVVNDALQELRELNADAETPEAPAESPAPAPEKVRITSLDDFIIDDPRLPSELRGKPASALFEDRTEGWRRAHEGGFIKNRLEAERDMALAALERTIAKFAPTPAEPQPVTTADRLKQRGIDSSNAFHDGDRSLAAAAEAGADDAEERIRPVIDELKQELETVKAEREAEKVEKRNESYFKAFQSARPENIPQPFWNDRFSGYASSFAIQRGLPLNDRATYEAAWSDYRATFEQFPGDKPTPAPAPAVTAPAPPVGGGKPAAPPQSKPTAHLNNHQREAAAKITGIFAKVGMTATADDILDDIRKDPKTRSVFP